MCYDIVVKQFFAVEVQQHQMSEAIASIIGAIRNYFK